MQDVNLLTLGRSHIQEAAAEVRVIVEVQLVPGDAPVARHVSPVAPERLHVPVRSPTAAQHGLLSELLVCVQQTVQVQDDIVVRLGHQLDMRAVEVTPDVASQYLVSQPSVAVCQVCLQEVAVLLLLLLQPPLEGLRARPGHHEDCPHLPPAAGPLPPPLPVGHLARAGGHDEQKPRPVTVHTRPQYPGDISLMWRVSCSGK